MKLENLDKAEELLAARRGIEYKIKALEASLRSVHEKFSLYIEDKVDKEEYYLNLNKGDFKQLLSAARRDVKRIEKELSKL